MRTVAVLLLSGLVVRAAADPAELLSQKDVAKRLEAVATLHEQGDARAEALLLGALKDRDWEVVERAAAALGTRGGAASINPLVGLALRGPVRRIRLVAAASLKKLSDIEAAMKLAKRLRGATTIAAAEALAIVAHRVAAKDLERVLRRKGKKVGSERVAALKALAALGEAERIPAFTKLLGDPDYRVRAAAVDALVGTKAPIAIAPLRNGLQVERMTAVMERRHIAGIRALLKAETDRKTRDFAAQMVVRSFGMGGSPEADARFARLLGWLGRHDAPVGPVDEYIRVLARVGLRHRDPRVRAAAVAALGRIERPASYDRVAERCRSDRSERVRFHALRAAVAIKGGEALPLLLDRLAQDESFQVREEAAVICGRLRLKDSALALIAALKDKDWQVCTGAAISVGRLGDARALSSLGELLRHKDWRRRGAAVAGLGWIKQKAAVPALIGALRDKEPAVARTALESLRRLAAEKLGSGQKVWRNWWSKQEGTFVFRDRDLEAKEAKKYGYALQPRKVYEDLDIVVLQTRRGGDNIQFLLTDYGIDHRTVRAASLSKCGLHPRALFVANCPGEITNKDVERVQWYVRAGGYLFASCWALTHTVQFAFPDVVQKLETRAQVIDTVESRPVPTDSELIDGVFSGTTVPYWRLLGSHLIDVIDPERFEVLIDSPETATRWGDGNLAGWFTIGHGLVLDSANHFDLQGMREVSLSNEKERMAFAMDHLGYDYAELRKLKQEGVFAKQPLAVKRTRDQTIFRFITNFVRQKRLADEE